MYQAVILAGGVKRRLRAGEAETLEALLDIGGRPMLFFVLEALLASRCVSRAVVVGPPALGALRLPERAVWAQGAETVLGSLAAGLAACGGADRVLVVTADAPLLTAAAVDDFVARCGAAKADLYYAIVGKAVCRKQFPASRRTFVRLKDGSFTGGNLFLLHPAILPQCLRIGAQAVAARKKPWRLASLLGWRTLLRFACGALSVDEARRRVEEILGVRCAVFVSPHAALAVDVDKPDDLALARALLAARSE